MPQIDFTTLFTATTTLIICCILYYQVFSLDVLSEILLLKKFRVKLASKDKFQLNNVSLPNVFIFKTFLTLSEKN